MILDPGPAVPSLRPEPRSKRLRIAVITEEYPNATRPYLGIFNYRTLSSLQHWDDVQVFCPVAHYPRWRFLQPKSFLYQQASLECPYPDVPARYVEYGVLPLVSRALNGDICARAMEGLIREHKPDLVLGYWLYPSAYAAVRIARKLGVPVIVTALGSDLRQISDGLVRQKIQWTLANASFVITVSEELRERAMEMGAPPERVQAVLNGCDSSVFTRGDRGDARRELQVDHHTKAVLFVGRLIELKGVRELIDAVALALPAQPNLTLFLIGEGPLAAQLHQLAIARGVSDRVRFVGQCSPAEIAKWLAASDLLCLPSYSEGCPNVILEALSCGRPVVASEVGGIPELIDPTCGILVPPRSSAQLANGLLQALSRTWDEAAIARTRRSWEDVAGDTHEICQRVASPVHPSAATPLPEPPEAELRPYPPLRVGDSLAAAPYSQEKKHRRVIINGDDFGWSIGVTEGILVAHRRGALRSTSLMVNQAASEYAIAEARKSPDLGVGIHLHLCDGRPVLPAGSVPSLVDSSGRFYSVLQFRRRLWRGRVSSSEIEREFRAQIQWMKQRGISPTHADSHHHVHLHPIVTWAFRRALRSEGVRCARGARQVARPSDGRFGQAHAGWLFRRLAVSLYMEALQATAFHGFVTPDSRLVIAPKFRDDLGLLYDGWRGALADLPPGTYEMECHPGVYEPGFSENDRFRNRRELERMMLTDEAFLHFLSRQGIALINYADL